MKILNTSRNAALRRTIILISLSLCSQARSESLVNFTVSINTNKDIGAYYDNLHEADQGFVRPLIIGFQVSIHSVDGTVVNASPLAAFCCELEESIDTTNYTFVSRSLCHLAAGQAGVAGTASSSIPEGGIGPQRAAYVSYLFDHYYISEALSEWTYTQTSPFIHAFQLALWELTHDTDMSLYNTSGDVYFGAQTSGTATKIERRNNAIAIAQTMVDDVRNANINSLYSSTNFSICALTDVSGAGSVGYQDVILATKKGSSSAAILDPLITIPEPGVPALMAMVAGFFWFICRVRHHLYS